MAEPLERIGQGLGLGALARAVDSRECDDATPAGSQTLGHGAQGVSELSARTVLQRRFESIQRSFCSPDRGIGASPAPKRLDRLPLRTPGERPDRRAADRKGRENVSRRSVTHGEEPGPRATRIPGGVGPNRTGQRSAPGSATTTRPPAARRRRRSAPRNRAQLAPRGSNPDAARAAAIRSPSWAPTKRSRSRPWGGGEPTTRTGPPAARSAISAPLTTALSA